MRSPLQSPAALRRHNFRCERKNGKTRVVFSRGKEHLQRLCMKLSAREQWLCLGHIDAHIEKQRRVQPFFGLLHSKLRVLGSRI